MEAHAVPFAIIDGMRRAVATALSLAALAGAIAASHSAGAAGDAQGPPVVVVVFDALPVQLLETDRREIDAARFPNFAKFARTGTWFRNATTISESTRFSVPAILDGRRPQPQQSDTLESHPENLFTLLQPGYRLNVWEEATALCPCEPHSHADLLWRMRHERASRFRSAIAAVSDGDRPQLTFIHALLPHEPRQYLPDGRLYRSGNSPDELGGPPGYDNRFLTRQTEQRTLLQLQFADTLLGELVADLERKVLFDKSMVVLVSDHGESFATRSTPEPPFKKGKLTFRRAITRANFEDIAGIAMFVKYPGQRRGRPDDRFVRHVDLLPTILHQSGVPRPAGLIGSDLRDPGYRGHATVEVQKQNGRVLSMPVARFRRLARASHNNRIALFGQGTRSLFDFGPAAALRGTPVGELRIERRGRLRARVAQAPQLANVQPAASFVPAQVFGSLRGPRPQGRTLAFALNGTVVATGPSFKSPHGTRYAFSAMLPPDAFRRGANHLEIFQVLNGRHVRRLYG
jgi:hypothetical protein